MYRMVYIPLLERPIEESEWDIDLFHLHDAYGHTGAVFLTFGYIDRSNTRWIEYDPVYEKMWEDTARTVDPERQEAMIRNIFEYLHERALGLTLYSPLLLYAVNKEVNFFPQKSQFLRFKDASVTDRHWSVRGHNN
jgi:ABC-type transport system substrate-binding protein